MIRTRTNCTKTDIRDENRRHWSLISEIRIGTVRWSFQIEQLTLTNDEPTSTKKKRSSSVVRWKPTGARFWIYYAIVWTGILRDWLTRFDWETEIGNANIPDQGRVYRHHHGQTGRRIINVELGRRKYHGLRLLWQRWSTYSLLIDLMNSFEISFLFSIVDSHLIDLCILCAFSLCLLLSPADLTIDLLDVLLRVNRHQFVSLMEECFVTIHHR